MSDDQFLKNLGIAPAPDLPNYIPSQEPSMFTTDPALDPANFLDTNPSIEPILDEMIEDEARQDAVTTELYALAEEYLAFNTPSDLLKLLAPLF